MSAYEMYGSSPAPASPHSPTQSSEKSVKSCYAVVYELKNRKWAVSGEGGWSEVHLCKDFADNSHRILAWTVKNQNVLMNCNVTGECSYKEKSKNFHSFTDENGNRFGLGFHKSDSGLRQALHFLNAVVEVIKEGRSQDLNGFTLAQASPGPSAASAASSNGVSGAGPPPNPYQAQANNANNTQNNYNTKPLPPNPKRDNNNSSYNNTSYQNNTYNSGGGGGASGAPPMMSSMQAPPLFSSAAASGTDTTQTSNNYNNNNINNNTNANGNVSYNNGSNNNYSNNTYNNNNINNSYQQQEQQQTQVATQPPRPPQPPPNPFQKQVSPQQGPKKPVQPTQPPQFSQAKTSLATNNNNVPQLNRPASPYQSTTDNVSLTPVQAAVPNDDQKQQHNGALHARSKSPGIAEENLPSYHLSKNQTKSLPSQPIGPLGTLKILPPKPNKTQGGDKKILNPDSVSHTVRVVHDKDTGQFHGLPKEWMEALNKQFGVKPHLLPGVQLAQYTEKIPKVLVTLREQLEAGNAYDVVGIFRLAPNATQNDLMKDQIDKGRFDAANQNNVDVNVYANLIKVWFRDLPDPILNCVDPTMIELAQTEPEVEKVVSKFPEPQKSIFQWLCDMCCECAKNEKTNKMGSNNLAIVIGPNLFNTDNFENPMKAMTFSGKVVQFFKLAIQNRQKELAS